MENSKVAAIAALTFAAGMAEQFIEFRWRAFHLRNKIVGIIKGREDGYFEYLRTFEPDKIFKGRLTLRVGKIPPADIANLGILDYMYTVALMFKDRQDKNKEEA